MRLLRLDLDRYGPFTGRTLSFPPEARLHVVHGPNEAGKSCALAAVTDLLFGIERQTRYDFLHEGKDLRIGAEIVGRDGSRLTFRRRKGNKNTLLGPDDSPIADDALLPYLGGLTRDVFCRAFGLNAETLRRGAEDMLRSDGEAGASLFAAASGLRGLSDLRRSLEDEASTIFAPRASKDRRFYQALDRFEDARKAIRECELRAGDWKALNEFDRQPRRPSRRDQGAAERDRRGAIAAGAAETRRPADAAARRASRPARRLRRPAAACSRHRRSAARQPRRRHPGRGGAAAGGGGPRPRPSRTSTASSWTRP